MTPTSKSRVEAVSALSENRFLALLCFVGVLDSPMTKVEDPETFRAIIVEATSVADISVAQLSHAFGVHASTITRWLTGKSSPQPLVRKVIVDWIRSEVNNQIDQVPNLSEALNNVNRVVEKRLQRVAVSA